MKALSLLGVFLLAKALVLAGRDLSLSLWTPVAYLWQDLFVVLVFLVIEQATQRRPAIGWGLYGTLVLYTAVNVPVACLLSTPLTWPMIQATRGTLADSILHHVTFANLLRVGVVVAAGLALPMILRRYEKRIALRAKVIAVLIGAVAIALGPLATARVDTMGLHRNPVIALAGSALPRITAAQHPGDWATWRLSPFGNPRGEDLTHLRGAAAGRNVVVIHLESTGARYLKPYGAAEDPMPTLTALAREAILFENAYTVYPETIKSFFAVQCATHPALDVPAEAYARVRPPALADLLRGQGYRTGLFHSGRFNYLGMEAVVRDRGYDTLEDAGAIGGERDSSFGIDEESAVRRMLAWIDALPRGQRFLLSYLPIAGHHPYATPAPGPFGPEEKEINRYRNALHYGDQALAELLRGLRERGLERETLFLIFGDHGEAFGQHDGNFGHTLFLFEENVRVPYLIVAPGLISAPTRVGRTASLADTAPTVLDLLGLPRPAESQGRSLLDPESRLALFCTDYSLGFAGLRDGRWKVIHEIDSDRTRLFDLLTDPEERHDLAASHPERAEAYRDHLVRWCAAQKFLVNR